MRRVKPSPAYRGWPRRGRVWRGAGTIFGLPGKTIGPTSVSPKGLPPSPRGEGFPQKLLHPTSILRHSPGLLIGQTAPSKRGAKGLYLVSVPTAPHPSRRWRATFLQGKAFLCPGGLLHRICRSGIATRRAGHAAAPTVHRQWVPEIRAHRNTKAAGTTCGFRMKEIRGEEKMKKKKQLKFCSASLLCSFIIPGKCEERKW